MLRDVLNRTAAQFDIAASRALFHRSARSLARSRTESLSPAERLRALDAIVALYDRPEHYAPDAPFHPAPPTIAPREERVRALPSRSSRLGGEVVDWRWPSDFAPLSPDIADRYLGFAENRLAGARLFLHADGPRPVAILLHGYRAGQYAVEELVWPIEWLLENGLDVAIPALPFHGVRAPRLASSIFPGSDPRITNEGFRQAVLDLRTLTRHLLDRGAPHVGVMGMSLGGYTTALLATLERRLSFAVPMIPLASLAHMAKRLGRLTGTPEEQRAQFEALDAAHRPLSPLARPPLLASERILITAAEGDRITPIEHARSLAAHFHAELHVFQGGHILQFGRADAFRAIGRLLTRLGLFGR